ncbi:hypothetical protein HPT28_08245 [Streptomyces sp. JJ38]|nr:hypothetical protein [Streptomyces sp. JJ38]
MDRDGDGVGCE